jgi:hypothetical protein
MIGERQDIRAALSERRDSQRKNVQTKIKVFAKVAAGDGGA